MAAAVSNGCVVTSKLNSNKLQECSGKEGKLLNGKVSHHTNGYTKTSQQSNGTSHNNVVGEKGSPMPAPMDWSQYDTFPGSFEKSSLLTAVLTHLGLYMLFILGFINKYIRQPKIATEKNREGYTPLYESFEQFFSHYVYRRVRHCFNRPICSAPGAELTLKERATDDHNWTFRVQC